MKRQNTRTLALIVSTFTYLLIGAAIFDYLESDNERKQDHMLITSTGFYRQKYNISSEDWRIIETIVVRQVPHKAGRQWSFAGALYFSLTVLTTIGYGHSAPLTQMGKIFCMLYAVTGIPLSLVMYQSVGERINTGVGFMLRHAKRCARMAQQDVTDTDLIVVIGSLSTLVILVGAWGFAHNENWSYFDAIYYCFITLSTIGFGDYVALQKDHAFDNRWQYVAFSIIFILIGLNTFAALMNLLVLRFLTANTEDERKQALEAEVARASAVQVQGDVITRNKANGQILSNQRGSLGGAAGANTGGMAATETRGVAVGAIDPDGDRRSVCSCSCYSYRPNAPIGGMAAQIDDESPPGTPLLIPSQAHHQNAASQSRQHSSDFTTTTAVDPHHHQQQHQSQRIPHVYSSHDMDSNPGLLSHKLRPYTVTRSPGTISHLLNTHQNLVAHHTLAGPYFYSMPTASSFRPSSATFSTTAADDALSSHNLHRQQEPEQHHELRHR